MKRIFTFLFTVLCSVPMLFAQISLTKATHGFIPGQSHESQEVEYQGPGNAGKNVVWDFSAATVLEGKTDSFSEILDNNAESSIKVERSDNCTFFFNITEYANEYVGYKYGPTTYILTEPLVKTRYPQSYGTQFEGKFSGTVRNEGSERFRAVEGLYSTHADATGTIILPDDTKLQVLRVKTTERRDEKNYSRELVKYLWYAQDVRIPVFVTMEEYKIASDGTTTLVDKKSYLNKVNKVSVKSSGNNSSSINLESDIAYNVYPNPFKNEVQLSYYLPEETTVTIELYDARGAKLTSLVSNQLQSGNNSIKKDVAQFTQTADVYLLVMKFGNKTYTEKLIKTN